jgi:hypothetical protein
MVSPNENPHGETEGGAITFKRFNRILLSRRTDITTLSVQDDWHLGRDAPDVFHQTL